MKKGFVSSRGSVEVERDILFIKNKKSYFFETGFAKIAYSLIPPIGLFIVFFMDYDPFRFFMRVLLFGIWTLDRIPSLYRLIFKTSFSKRIPLQNIVSAETKEDIHGLEVDVLLHLRNNRVRVIPFRKLEKQYEELLSVLPVSSSMVGIA